MDGPGFKDGLPDEAYRIVDAWSSTDVRAVLKSARRGIASRRGEIEEKEGQLQGSLNHCLVLTPELFDKEYILMEPGQRRSPREKKFQELLETGRIPVKPEEVTKASRIADAVHSDPLWQGITEPGCVRERSWFWTDEETGVPCKARTDGFVEGERRNLLLDLKPAPGDEDFGKFCFRKGYHIQAAWYARGVKAVTGKPCDFMVVSVSDILEVNFDLLCVAEAMTNMHQLAEQEIQKALERIKLCTELDEWPSRNDGRVQTLEPPRWALRDLDDTLNPEPF